MTEKQPAAKSTALANWEQFESELHAREHELATMLPPTITKDRFMATAIAAVKQTPELLKATPRSLFGALTKAAQDGLLPDGRDGVIVVFNTDVGDNKYEQTAQWMPMVGGLRKRARDLDNIIVDAQVIHEFDEFVWTQGDTPAIHHVPAKLGNDRGRLMGAYAIFKKDGVVLHREVMASPDIEKVREQSRAKNSLMWTKFISEGYRKTVIRRGIKAVPMSDKLALVVKGDDETFDFTAPIEQDERVMIPPRPQRSEFARVEHSPGMPIDMGDAGDLSRSGRRIFDHQRETVTVQRDPATVNRAVEAAHPHQMIDAKATEVAIDPKAARAAEQLDKLQGLRDELMKAETLRQLMAICDRAEKLLLPAQEAEWNAVADKRQAEIMEATHK